MNGYRHIFTLLIVAICVAGCGYQQTESGYKWSSLHREDITSIAVPIFTNKTFDRGVEFKLTQAVIQRIESATPYKVKSRREAQTVLEGEIVSIKTDPIGRDRLTANPQEQLYVLVIDFVWKDLRSGQILRQRQGFEQTSSYYPTLGEGRFAGKQKAVEELAVGIVQELEADW